MLTWYVRGAAVLLCLSGLAGFSLGGVPGLAQLDLFQSFAYLIAGASGLQLGFGQATTRTRARYALATGLGGYALLALGLTFPNLGDVFHLELPEDVFHAVLGLAGSFVGEHYLKQVR